MDKLTNMKTQLQTGVHTGVGGQLLSIIESPITLIDIFEYFGHDEERDNESFTARELEIFQICGDPRTRFTDEVPQDIQHMVRRYLGEIPGSMDRVRVEYCNYKQMVDYLESGQYTLEFSNIKNNGEDSKYSIMDELHKASINKGIDLTEGEYKLAPEVISIIVEAAHRFATDLLIKRNKRITKDTNQEK